MAKDRFLSDDYDPKDAEGLTPEDDARRAQEYDELSKDMPGPSVWDLDAHMDPVGG
jgi:hypothetical protein